MGAFIAGLLVYVVAILIVVGVYEWRMAKYRKVIATQHKVITLLTGIVGAIEETNNEEEKEKETQDAGK